MKTSNGSLSRRRLFKKGAAAAASATLIAQGRSLFGQAPAVVTARTFRAWISRGTGRGRTTLQEVRLRPVTGRQVVVRTESCNLCYSNVGAVLGIQPAPPSGGAATPVNAGLTGANTERHGAHPGPRRRGRRRGGRPRSTARPGRRSCLRVGHAAMWLLLSLPARTRGRVPIARA